MDADLKDNVSSTSTWGRALFMILFGIIYSVAEIVLVSVVLFQFCFVLFTGSANVRLLAFGKEISEFIYAVFLYLTYNSEERPFPFAPWPSEDDSFDSAEDPNFAEGSSSAEAPRPAEGSNHTEGDAEFSSDDNELIEGSADKK